MIRKSAVLNILLQKFGPITNDEHNPTRDEMRAAGRLGMILNSYSDGVELDYNEDEDLMDADYDNFDSSSVTDSEYNDTNEATLGSTDTLKHVTFGTRKIAVERVKECLWFYYKLPTGSRLPDIPIYLIPIREILYVALTLCNWLGLFITNHLFMPT